MVVTEKRGGGGDGKAMHILLHSSSQEEEAVKEVTLGKLAKKGFGKKIAARKSNKRRVGGSRIEGEHEEEDGDNIFEYRDKSNKKESKRSKNTEKSSSKKSIITGTLLQ